MCVSTCACPLPPFPDNYGLFPGPSDWYKLSEKREEAFEKHVSHSNEVVDVCAGGQCDNIYRYRDKFGTIRFSYILSESIIRPVIWIFRAAQYEKC